MRQCENIFVFIDLTKSIGSDLGGQCPPRPPPNSAYGFNCKINISDGAGNSISSSITNIHLAVIFKLNFPHSHQSWNINITGSTWKRFCLISRWYSLKRFPGFGSPHDIKALQCKMGETCPIWRAWREKKRLGERMRVKTDGILPFLCEIWISYIVIVST